MSGDLVALRRALHRRPELSDHEHATAALLKDRLAALGPDRVWTGLGGAGLAVAFDGESPGPTRLWRSELDALPILETDDGRAHRSEHDGVAHLCGHDGHMAIAVGVAQHFAAERPAHGRVVVLFQPAEETGAGARRVAADPRYRDEIAPDFAFALHNLPGFPAGSLVVRDGTFCCASRGLAVRFTGRTAHAAQPETGLSPAPAMCRAVEALTALPHDPALAALGFTLATVVHARLGELAYGTAPGHAEVHATLRATTNAAMDQLAQHAEQSMRALASADGLDCQLAWSDVFDATVNDPAALAPIRATARSLGLPLRDLPDPFRWSEDFGALATAHPGTHLAMFGLGAGEHTPPLHDQRYDFPDELLPRAVDFVSALLRAGVNNSTRPSC